MLVDRRDLWRFQLKGQHRSLSSKPPAAQRRPQQTFTGLQSPPLLGCGSVPLFGCEDQLRQLLQHARTAAAMSLPFSTAAEIDLSSSTHCHASQSETSHLALSPFTAEFIHCQHGDRRHGKQSRQMVFDFANSDPAVILLLIPTHLGITVLEEWDIPSGQSMCRRHRECASVPVFPKSAQGHAQIADPIPVYTACRSHLYSRFPPTSGPSECCLVDHDCGSVWPDDERSQEGRRPYRS